ncbi:EAL domain-containing protein [Mesobacillus maritimus]|uniref:bifunctional diguanylate cyclase/phosphodiesterase n=1 Tax=Mesobacillus maritimus TaxID=1643336 RepID=UPI002041EC7F|nr:EAL domain-containing protein [Mesobacillus maritimus]MCM3585897.1 EAL domain-containing protein [Mesobacillus maritimus]
MGNISLFTNYNSILFILSIITSILTSYTAIELVVRARDLYGMKRASWLLGSAFNLGLGIWSMHYIGILALMMPHPVEYSPLNFLLTFVLAFLLSTIPLFIVVTEKIVAFRATISGVLMGIGIGVSHGSGMSTFHQQYEFSYDPVLTLGGVIFSCICSTLAFKTFITQGAYFWGKLKSGLLLGSAISGLHYLAMLATDFVYHYDGHSEHFTPMVKTTLLGIGVETTIVMVGILLLVITKIDQKMDTQKETIQLNEQYYKSLYEQNPDTILTFDLEGRFLTANQALTSLFGYRIEDLVNKPFTPYIVKQDLEKAQSNFKKAVEGTVNAFECVIIDSEGNHRQNKVINIPIVINGKVIGVYSIIKDVTELKQAEQELLEAEAKYRSLVEHSLVGVYILQDNRMVYVNPGLCEIIGYSYEEAITKSLDEIIHPDDINKVKNNVQRRLAGSDTTNTYQYRALKRDRTVITLQVYGTKIMYNGKNAVIGTVIDVTEQQQNEAIIKHMAYHDQLTDLPNRNLFYKRITELIDISTKLESEFALLFVDLDRFKLVNDNLGHEIGDQLLIKIADKMKSCLRENDLISRHGGDEFTILLSDSNLDTAVHLAKQILAELSKPVTLRNHEIVITPSIGMVLFPRDGVDPDTLIQHADIAMYHAKKQGSNRFQIFAQELMKQKENEIKMDMDLRKALERNELFLVYQPQFNLESKEIIGVEALIRWNHPEKGVIAPSEFIPFAEESGLIFRIGEWAIREACQQNKNWQAQGFPPITISVNISPKQFQAHLVKQIETILRETELGANYLELEITENITMDVECAIVILQDLKKIGVNISIDDFGTGYSSLSYLKKFPIDKLKIDQSFIRDICSASDRTLVMTIIMMAHHLNLKVIAEGVETEEHVRFLKKHHCDEAQGYYFSQAVSAEEMEVFWK